MTDHNHQLCTLVGETTEGALYYEGPPSAVWTPWRRDSDGLAQTRSADAEVRLHDAGVGEQFLTRAGLGDPPGLQHIGAVRPGQRLLWVLLHQQHRRALLVDLGNDPE